jgi:hypothetical protein
MLLKNEDRGFFERTFDNTYTEICIVYTALLWSCSNSMKQSPSSEAYSRSAITEISRYLWYHINKIPSLYSLLEPGASNAHRHTLFFKGCYIISPSTPCPSRCSPLSGLTNSMEQNRYWESNNYSTCEYISLFYETRRFCVHKVQPLVPILSRIHTDQNFSLCFSKIHFIIILSSTLRSSNWSLPFKFSNENFVCISHLSCVCYMPHLSNSPWLYHSNYIWWSVQVMKLLIM